MADTAKIVIETIAKNDDLKKLNKDLAIGQQEVKKLTQQLKDLEKKTKNGTDATSEQAKEMQRLTASINSLKNSNNQLQKSIRKTTDDLFNSGKQAKNASGDFKNLANQLKTVAGQKLGIDFSNLNLSLVGVAGAIGSMGKVLFDANMEMQGFVNTFRAFQTETQTAKDLYSQFNAVYRDTNYSESGVYEMAQQMLRLGYNAKDAELMIRRVADTSAGLGTGEEGAKRLVETIARLSTVGTLSSKQLMELKQNGLDVCTIASERFGMSYEEASQAIQKGTIDNTELIKAMYDEMGNFDGKMAEVKDNAIDAWSDVQGNITEVIRATSDLIAEMMGYDDTTALIHDMADATQRVLEVVQDVKDWVGYLREEFDNTFAEDVYNSIADMLNPLRRIYNAVKDIISAYREMKALITGEEGGYTNYDSDYHDRTSGGGLSYVPVARNIKQSGGGGSSKSSGGSSSAKASKEVEEKKLTMDELNKLALQHLENERTINELSNAEYNARLVQQLTAYKVDLEERLKDQEEYSQEYINIETNLANTIRAIQKATTQEHKVEVEKIPQFYKQMASSFASAMTECITGAKSFGEAFKQIIQSIIQQLIQAVMYALILSALGYGGGAGAKTFGQRFSGNFKSALGLADGGYVSGAGTSTSDSIPANLSNGEYVLNAECVKKIGIDNLNRLNYGTQNFAEGGAVTSGQSITMNIQTMDANSFEGFLSNGAFDKIKQAFTNDERTFTASAGVW